MSKQLSHLLFAALADIGRFYNGHQVCIVSKTSLTKDALDDTPALQYWKLSTDVQVGARHFNSGLYLVDTLRQRVWKWHSATEKFQPMVYTEAQNA